MFKKALYESPEGKQLINDAEKTISELESRTNPAQGIPSLNIEGISKDKKSPQKNNSNK